MPWELQIVRYHGEEEGILGDRQAVIDHLAAVFPGWSLSPPVPSQAFLDKLSPEARELFLKPTFRLLYEEDDVSFDFWCPDRPEIASLHADVRGSGNPLPVLRRLCQPVGWTVFDLAEYQRHWGTCSALELQKRAAVDLDAACSAHWESFNDWLDAAIELARPPERTAEPD